MPNEEWSQLIAFTVNSLGGGIVGAIAALCCVHTESARDGFRRSVVSIIVSGGFSVPAMRLIRWKWPAVPDDFEVRFVVQLVLGVFGYHILRWPMNEVEGTEKMKLSRVLATLIKAFGPIVAKLRPIASKLGPWLTKLGKDGKK